MSKAARKTKSSAKSNPSIYWVGIGASAGGLEALRAFTRNLSNDLPATYIVAQHVAPQHKSMLTDIIRRETEMKVLDVTDNLLPEPNTIYITPPNTNIVVKRNRLRLIEPSKDAAAPKPSVDIFFKSMASSKKSKTIGIIMSGTGKDGAEGIEAINKQGGIVIAQDQMSAKYTSMPQAATETGLIDLIMAPEEMGQQFPKIVASPRNLDELKSSPANLDAISELIQLLLKATKVNFAHYKSQTLQRRIQRRISAVGLVELDDYVDLIKDSPEEIQRLYKDLLISVTSFFRDPSEFSAVEQYIENIVKEKKGDAIRVWVPGAATGEEAYSIAILFSEAARKLGVSIENKLQIFATDLDVDAIALARRGYYAEPNLGVISPELLERYFESAPNGYILKKTIREKMVFSIHNLAQDPPFLNLDMVSCRNLLIYFQTSLQSEVFSRFHYALVPNGLLFVGKSEAITASELMFRAADNQKHIFFQRPSHERRAPRDMLYERPSACRINSPKEESKKDKLLENANARFQSVVAALGPNALLINSDLQIISPFGDVSRYVSINPGTVSNTVASLIKPPFKQDVQFSVPSVIRNKKPSVGTIHSSDENSKIKDRIMVYPLEGGADEEVLALAVFKSWEEESPGDSATSTNADSDKRIEELGNELEITKINLQQTVEELETSNEELQALNEELQSSNEELQSTNEELSTVNEELQVNSQQLNVVNYNMGSILQNLSMPLLVVDRNFNITNVSQASEDFFSIAADLVLPHISRCRLPVGFPDLSGLINQAMVKGKKVQVEIEHKNTSLNLIVVPHISAAGEIMGAIILVNDNTELLANTRNELQLIFDNVPSAIILRTATGNILKANKTARKFLNMEDKDLTNTNFYDFFDKSVVGDLISFDREALSSNKPLLNIESDIKYKTGENIFLRMSRIPGIHPETNDPIVYGVAENITEQHEIDQKLKESEKRLGLALNASKLGIWEFDLDTGRIFWSKGIAEFLGVTFEEEKLKIEDLNSRIHPDDRENVLSAIKQHFKIRSPYSMTFRFMRDDETYIWVEATGQAEWNDTGRAVKFTGTLEDISVKHKNYFAMQARDTQMNMAAGLSGVGYWDVNLVENTVFWSDQVFKIHGVTPSEYTPELETALSFYSEDDQEDVTNRINEAIAQGKPFEFEGSIIRKSGETRYVKSIGAPNFDNEKRPTGIYGAFRDITEDKLREEELKSALKKLSMSSEELNRFSYVCTHDMKEPVRLIEGMTSLLVDPAYSPDEDKRNDMLKRINKNTIYLRTLIESLLAYSRIDARVENSNVDLAVVLDEVKEILSFLISEQSVELTVSDMPKFWCAKDHFSQLFKNLIENAIKYNNVKNPKVEVSSSEDKDGLTIYVDDNGPGIPEDERATIFQLFGRAKKEGHPEGSGIGLSIVQKIVDQHGGTIICSDSPLGGARFQMHFPSKE